MPERAPVAFVDELPHVEIRGGIAYTEMFSGGVCISRTALGISQFIANVAICNEAIREWEAGQTDNVVALPIAEPKFERVYPH